MTQGSLEPQRAQSDSGARNDVTAGSESASQATSPLVRGSTSEELASTKQHAIIAISRRPRPGKVAEFEKATRGVIAAAGNFAGYLDSSVLRPEAADGEWRLTLRFADEESLARWRQSGEQKAWVGLADALTSQEPRVERANGLEAWFTLPDRRTAPPPKWKTAIVSGIAIYPMISVMPSLVGPLIASVPGWAANLVGVAIMTPLMTWVVMPSVTRVFRFWLYPGEPSQTQVTASPKEKTE